MTPRKPGKGKSFPKVPNASDPLKQIHEHAAGIDAHSKEHFVAVPPGSTPAGFVNPSPNLPPFVRVFGTNTADLEALVLWLQQCGITTVAVESTGVYHEALVGDRAKARPRDYRGGSASDRERAGPSEDGRAGLPMDPAFAQLWAAAGVVYAQPGDPPIAGV